MTAMTPIRKAGAAVALDIAVALPAHLSGPYGESVRATLTGAEGAPVVAVLGGISANRFVVASENGGPGWWKGLVGDGAVIDPAGYRILGLDFAADESGRAAPSSHDQAEVLAAALDALGIDTLHAIVGASYGGMVALAFAETWPDRVGRLVIASAGARPHPAATAVRELQRRVVALGIAGGRGTDALAIARGMAMLTYRTSEEFGERFEGGLTTPDPLGQSDCGDYLRARGQAYRSVMSPQRFLSLSASIDRHKVDAGRITTPALLIGATTDQLVPPGDMEELAESLGGPVELHLHDCLYGHDMFLKEAAYIGEAIGPFLAKDQA